MKKYIESQFGKSIGLIGIVFIVFTISAFGQGMKFDPDAFGKGKKIERTRADVVPKVASLKGYTPYVMTQNRSNCVAYSLATARTMLLARNHRITGRDTITAFYFSPHWIYYRTKDDSDDNCMEGLDIEKASLDLLNNGVPFMADVEYEKYYPFGDIELCNYYPNVMVEDIEKAIDYKVDEIYRVEDLDGVKLAISSGFPTVVGMLLPDSFKEQVGKDVWTTLPTDGYEGAYGHAMVVVGYDDYKYGGAIEIMNSWGDEWGNEGFIWIRYKDFMKYTLGAYSMEKKLKLGVANPHLDSKLREDKLISNKTDKATIEKFSKMGGLFKALHKD